MIKIFLRYAFSLIAGVLFLALSAPDATAQSRKRMPLYIVNGEKMTEEQVKDINPKDIVDNHLLPADEQTIERYGHEAANGVVVITLRYDTPARFEIEGEVTKYSAYIADRVKWDETDPVARIIISFKVKADGSVTLGPRVQVEGSLYLDGKELGQWVRELVAQLAEEK